MLACCFGHFGSAVRLVLVCVVLCGGSVGFMHNNCCYTPSEGSAGSWQRKRLLKLARECLDDTEIALAFTSVPNECLLFAALAVSVS